MEWEVEWKYSYDVFQLILQWKSVIYPWNKEQGLEIRCVPIILATEIWNRPMEQGTEIRFVS